MGQTLNSNQFDVVPVPGLIEFNTRIITCQVDATQATALKNGQFVKFYASNTGNYPKVVAAGVSDQANGMVVYNVKDTTFSAGDNVDIVFFGGSIIWLQATAVAIAPGTQVQSDATGLLVEAYTSNKVRGIALDYFPASGMGRIIQLGVLQSA